MADYTLTYSESSQGFPSFYTYYPEWMVGMNNHFYTFKQGNLYRHNTNETRNNFYGQQRNSRITTVLNTQPLDNKLFKTISLESTDAWYTSLTPDIGTRGDIQSASFQKKEGAYYGFIRSFGVGRPRKTMTEQDYKLRSVFGIGQTTSAGSSYAVVSGRQSSLINVNDFLYFENAGMLTYFGKVETIVYSEITNTTTFTVDNAGGTPVVLGQSIYCVKDVSAESSGVMGHYSEVMLILPSSITGPSELFAIGADVIKSYP